MPAARVRYLAEIAETIRNYHRRAEEQAKIARERQQLRATKAMLVDEECAPIDALLRDREAKLDARAKKLLDMWPKTRAAYAGDEYVVKIRDKEVRTALTTTSLSGTKVPKVVLPKFSGRTEQARLAA